MAENPSNIQTVCSDCAPKPAGFEGDSVSLIGRYVKRGFEENGRTEHMWVRVRKVTDDGVLLGELGNDPVIVNDVKRGDTVTVELCEIEELFG